MPVCDNRGEWNGRLIDVVAYLNMTVHVKGKGQEKMYIKYSRLFVFERLNTQSHNP